MQRTQEEVKEAEKSLKNLETKFEVVDIDLSDPEDQDGSLLDDQPEFTKSATIVWSREGVRATLSFPMNNSVVCGSHDIHDIVHGGSGMPGVHALGVIDRRCGHFSQSILVKGRGCTMVGFVTSDKEKGALRRRAGEDFKKIPWMTMVHHHCIGDEIALTLEVDMSSRRATLQEYGPSPRKALIKVWENLPDQVWIAVAFMRATRREAILMPRNTK